MKLFNLPNLLPLINLCCGVLASILVISGGNIYTIFTLIIISLVADFLDGLVARAMKISSPIGKELDSLADLISFGVAPSVLIYSMYNFSDKGLLGYFLLLIFPVAGAYRLARYNIASFDGVFSGIPITIAGILLVIYSLGSPFIIYNQLITYLVIILLSYLMVSKVEFKKV